jgi:peptidoglycan hydrolase-like protein with peptidoglycan-binding domain
MDKMMKTGIAAFLILLVSVSALCADQAVENVQQALKDQGFYYGEITGEKNADTVAAIRRFQIRNGLQVTGDLNDETLRSIKSAPSSSAQPPAVSSSPMVSRSPDTSNRDTSDLRDDSREETGVNRPPSQPYAAVPRDRGPDGPNVGQLVPSGTSLFAATPFATAPPDVQRKVIADAQRILARRGLFKDDLDGNFGPALEFSLRAYQARVGLPPTGRLDLETLAALQLLPAARVPVFPPRRGVISPEPPVRGEWIRP